MIKLDDLFDIPADVQHRTPCLTSAALFTDPALDIDIDEPSWAGLTQAEQAALGAAKQAAEARAVAACATCPVLTDCRAWATRMGSTVFGVVGGLTQEQRTGVTVTATTARPTDGRVSHELVARWTEQGLSAREIAERLGCDQRTVERWRSRLASGQVVPTAAPAAVAAPAARPGSVVFAGRTKAPRREAGSELRPDRVTPETAVIFDALLDGAYRDRDDILELALPHVDRAVALAKTDPGRAYPDEDARARAGARKFLINRIDIAVRAGRIRQVTSDHGRTLLALDPATREVWSTHRAAAVA